MRAVLDMVRGLALSGTNNVAPDATTYLGLNREETRMAINRRNPRASAISMATAALAFAAVWGGAAVAGCHCRKTCGHRCRLHVEDDGSGDQSSARCRNSRRPLQQQPVRGRERAGRQANTRPFLRR